MKLLHKYQNGNYQVEIFEDGTKVRTSPDGEFNAEYPESIDLKITNNCSFGKISHGKVTSKICGFCHEQSFQGGQHASKDTIETLLDYFDGAPDGMEVAMGGGNALSHPDILYIAREMNKRGVILNLTHNQLHLDQDSETLNTLTQEGLVYGLGISYRGMVTNSLRAISHHKGFVLHVISGVDKPDDVLETITELKTKNVLILGYKDFGNGSKFMSEEVEKRKREWYNKLAPFVASVLRQGGNVLFDNLANEQLNVRRLFKEQSEYDTYYNGGDGTHTFYIDASTGMFGRNSCAPAEDRRTIENTSFKQMLAYVKTV